MADHKTLASLTKTQAAALTKLRTFGRGTPAKLDLTIAALDALVRKDLATKHSTHVRSPRTTTIYTIKPGV